MTPRARRLARAYGDLGAGTDGARRQHPGALPEMRWRSTPSTSAGGCEFVSPSRGPPDRAALGNEKDRVHGPVFQHIRAFQRGTKISTASVAGLRTDPRPESRSAPGRSR